ncbi:exodeoxyribonuclease VII large subunit [Bacteroides xylanisolvens]|jgi:exodeoxyribonuclease VII large subunit|uniref:exodeoxyribonuclease VII large subunit n=1 Tax=Bacteroides xylanisolvens TaxID=371601 RepID=UPI0035165363
MPEQPIIPTTANLFKPSEIIGILRNHLATGQVNQKVVCLRGIYFKGTYINQYFHTASDRLVDESTSDELTLSMPLNLREGYENGNVITVHGILDRTITNKGLIQIVLKVTEVEKLKELAVSEDEIKRTELRRIKSEKGFKNVDNILESLLYQAKRPQVALVYAETSITNEDFEKGVQAARTHIDFTEYRESFARTKVFCQKLKQLDTMNFDVIAIIRGGGAGLEALDEVELLETLVNMNTAWMYGAGHEGEKLFILNIADKAIAIPHALGTYFRDITDGVVQKRNNSRAALVKEVEGQFKKQIEDSNKKNQELTKQLEALQKQNKEQTEASNKKIEELTKAQKEHEKVVKEMTEQHKKATEEANKLHKTQNETLQKANTQLQEQLKTQGKTLTDLQTQQQKQQGEFNKSLGQMQETNKGLQASVNKMTGELMTARQRVTELESQSSGSTGYIIVIIILIILMIIGFSM